jgi:hypothetical protein
MRLLRRLKEALGDALRILPVWPVLVAVVGGWAVIFPVTFFVARARDLSGDWYPSAGSASGAWLCVVLIGVNVWEYTRIKRKVRDRILPAEERSAFQSERIGWVLAVGLLLGWQFFK